MWGVGLNPERLNVAEAELFPYTKAACAPSLCETVTLRRGRGPASRMEGNRRNMRGPTGSAGLVSGGGGRRGKAEAVLRAEVGSSDWFIVPMKPSKETRRVEGRDQPEGNLRKEARGRTQSRVTLPPTSRG